MYYHTVLNTGIQNQGWQGELLVWAGREDSVPGLSFWLVYNRLLPRSVHIVLAPLMSVFRFLLYLGMPA